MAVSTYTCPSCKAVLRPSQPVATGKKLRCPKCSTVFTAVPDAADEAAVVKRSSSPNAAAPKAKAPPAPVAAPAAADDEEDNSAYGVAKEDNAPAAPKLTIGQIRDRFPKSKRGPAIRMLVKPVNALITSGIIICIAAIVFFLYGMWPLVFGDPPPTGSEKTNRFMMMGAAVGAFLYGAVICFGAFKMQTLESYTWAMTAAVMAIVALGIGAWVISVLRNEVVLDGFAEKGPV